MMFQSSDSQFKQAWAKVAFTTPRLPGWCERAGEGQENMGTQFEKKVRTIFIIHPLFKVALKEEIGGER